VSSEVSSWRETEKFGSAIASAAIGHERRAARVDVMPPLTGSAPSVGEAVQPDLIELL
jgi:hypothetical protein